MTLESALKVTVAELGDERSFLQIGLVSASVAEELDLNTDEDIILVQNPKNQRAVLLLPEITQGNAKTVRLDGITRKSLDCGIIEDEVLVSKLSRDQILTVDHAELIITEVVSSDGTSLPRRERVMLLKNNKPLVRDKLNGKMFIKENIFEIDLEGVRVQFIIKGPLHPYFISASTVVSILLATEGIEPLTWKDIGGLATEIDKIREVVELPIKYPELFEAMNLSPPKGIILYGPPGTGKTLIAKAMSSALDYHMVLIDGSSMMEGIYGESEKRLEAYFKEAKDSAPSVIFIDELDALAPKREEGPGALEKRLVGKLLTLMDGVTKSDDPEKQVIVIGATNRLEAVDMALRRPGRFEIEIYVGVPDEQGRTEIFQIHLRDTPLESNTDIKDISQELAKETYGFVGADIAGLIRKAKLKTIRDVVPDIDVDVDITDEMLESLSLKKQYLHEGVKEIEPSAMRQFLVEIPRVEWEDIGGLTEEVSLIKESVALPLQNPELFAEIGIDPPSGLLLFGPPGCGKTLIAKAVATESNANFISVKGPEFLSKWVGESERSIRLLFSKARQVAPCIIFFDEIDSIVPIRGGYFGDSLVTERIIAQLLTELDGIEARDGIVVIFATNRPDIIDPALLRPGRIDKFIYVKAPQESSRQHIFKIHTRKMRYAQDVDHVQLANATDGFSGADIKAICTEAGMIAIRNKKKKVTMKHFEQAIETSGPSVTEDMLKFYEQINQRLTSHRRMRVQKSDLSDVI